MSWTMIRLELARTPAFPNGSAARSHVLRLPLGKDGLIDQQEYRVRPELATARRFWPNEPDRHGTLLHSDGGWALSYGPGDDDSARIYRLDAQAIQQGGQLTLTTADGERLPFVVKALTPA